MASLSIALCCAVGLVLTGFVAYGQAGPSCKDAKGEILCQYWNRFGACQSHPMRMLRNCAKTCQKCDVVDKCAAVKCPSPKYCTIDEKTKEPACKCSQRCRHKHRKMRLGKVCGTDGKTYASICKLESSACGQEKTIQVHHYGECKTTECKDNQPTKLCLGWQKAGACEAYPSMMKKYCAKMCGLCTPRALSPLTCQNSVMGCCWDLKTQATGPNGQGCAVCEDKLRFCKHFHGDCNSRLGSNRRLMRDKCASTCSYC